MITSVDSFMNIIEVIKYKIKVKVGKKYENEISGNPIYPSNFTAGHTGWQRCI